MILARWRRPLEARQDDRSHWVTPRQLGGAGAQGWQEFSVDQYEADGLQEYRAAASMLAACSTREIASRLRPLWPPLFAELGAHNLVGPLAQTSLPGCEAARRLWRVGVSGAGPDRKGPLILRAGDLAICR